MSPATPSNPVPMVRPDPEAPGVLAVTKADSIELRIPNVYMKGLPPNFPKEQLSAPTKDFGGYSDYLVLPDAYVKIRDAPCVRRSHQASSLAHGQRVERSQKPNFRSLCRLSRTTRAARTHLCSTITPAFQRFELSGHGDDSSPNCQLSYNPAGCFTQFEGAASPRSAPSSTSPLSDQRRIQPAQAQPNLHNLSDMLHQLPPHPVISRTISKEVRKE